MQFSSRTLKIVRTFFDRGYVTKKNYLPSSLYLKKEKSLNWAPENFYLTNKLNANVQSKNLAIAIMKLSLYSTANDPQPQMIPKMDRK